MQGTVTVN